MKNPETGGGTFDTAAPPLFREVQRVQPLVFWLPILAVTGIVWWQFIQQIVLDRPVGTNPLPDWLAWVLTIVFGLGLPALGLSIRLITEVRPGELRVRMAPFRGIRVPIDEIQGAVARRYSPMREYGGWGVRHTRAGRAYNARGDQGVQLELRSKGRIMIGSQRPEELVMALRSAGADLD